MSTISNLKQQCDSRCTRALLTCVWRTKTHEGHCRILTHPSRREKWRVRQRLAEISNFCLPACRSPRPPTSPLHTSHFSCQTTQYYRLLFFSCDFCSVEDTLRLSVTARNESISPPVTSAVTTPRKIFHGSYFTCLNRIFRFPTKHSLLIDPRTWLTSAPT